MEPTGSDTPMTGSPAPEPSGPTCETESDRLARAAWDHVAGFSKRLDVADAALAELRRRLSNSEAIERELRGRCAALEARDPESFARAVSDACCLTAAQADGDRVDSPDLVGALDRMRLHREGVTQDGYPNRDTAELNATAADVERPRVARTK